MGYEFVDEAPKRGRYEFLDEETPQKKGSGSDALDAGNALGTGYFRGLTRLVGLPMDTTANVLDLGKAALGAPYIAITGKAPPSWLEAGDRSKVVGSGDYLIDKARQTKLGHAMLDPSNPEYEGGYTQLAGGALTGVMRPSSITQAVNQGVNSVLGASAGKAAYDATGNTALSVLASMSPTALQSLSTEGVKQAIRGGESGRQAMAQRIQDLKNAGVNNPTMGLASGNALIGGAENLLANTPGAMNVMAQARKQAIGGLTDTVDKAASTASTNRGALESGTAIQSGIKDFKDQFKAKQSGLYDRMDQFIPPLTPANVSGTKDMLSRLNPDIPGAPELSKQFKNARIQSIERALLADSGMAPTGQSFTTTTPIFGNATPAPARDLMNNPVYRGALVDRVTSGPTSVTSIPTRPDMMGRMVPVANAQGTTRTIPGSNVPIYAPAPMRINAMGQNVPADPIIGERTTTIQPSLRSAFSGVGVAPQVDPTIPFEAMKKTRTLVGNEIADGGLLSDVPRSKWNALYGAISGDMQGAANQAGPQASKAFNRANDYTRTGIERLDRVAPFADKVAPEAAYTAMVQASKENVSTLQAVKKTLPEGARGTIAGTVIERLGKANNGVQNENGTAWSPETFLTNWNKMTPRARDEIFSGFPNSEQVMGDVSAVAKATSMMRDNSKIWANPSGTGANLAARGVLGALGIGGAGALTGLLNPMVPLGVLGGLGSANLAAKSLTSPRVVNSVASRSYIDPRMINAQINSLIGSGLLENRQGE